MGKLIFYGATSLDGYLATSDDNLDWLTHLTDIPTDAGTATLASMAAAIMGRVTYDYVAQQAPDAPFNPANPQMHNYVLTHQNRPNLPLTTFTDEDVVTLARDLRTQPGDTWIVGGQTILTPLLAAEMVDTLFLQLAPILLGQGKRLFGDLAQPQHFDLIQAHQLGPLAELVYQRRN
ncbi:dihydrofolate reductase family protein [Levilactobacillus suantsaiihabitans]|uniref:Dihydrofolate reductase n=1 Tax=Levilactobacillus suantsaiihabitans TaxID=2487722 RepID=A0A4Z0J7R7_9LACO|nr:dihydrofolate reductase family protein [Levilactobacillus suantsaiihabitans]TGD18096.1 dihydrofolate reductase [Levilactobacillus suantsaiihabitans]